MSREASTGELGPARSLADQAARQARNGAGPSPTPAQTLEQEPPTRVQQPRRCHVPPNAVVAGWCYGSRRCQSRRLSRVFTPQERDHVHKQVLAWASDDARVVAGAVVGSLAHHPGDRFSDIDLTFGVRDNCMISDVLEDWSQRLATEFDAVSLFDLPAGGAVYRVFLLPGCLQVDLSFAPASTFGPMGPQFRLLFGAAVDKPSPPSPDPRLLFGYGVHHAVRARICVERTSHWQAEYWISGVRDHALTMACLRLELPAHYGRGFDALPETIRNRAVGALVRSTERFELLRALKHATDLLQSEGALASVSPPQLATRLSEFVTMD